MRRLSPSRFLLSLSVLLLAPVGPSVCMASATESPQPRPRSVLFYLIDTCRADRLSVYDSDHFTTPFLEELAERSVVFENCHSQAPWTKPSMSSILTSRYSSETGTNQLFAQLSTEWTTFPEVLEEHGWYTAGFSANPIMGRMSAYTQGFRKFVESFEINEADPIRFASGSARKLNERIFPWLEEHDSWPVFLYVHSVDPHEEYEPAEEYADQFVDPERREPYREEWKKLLATRPPMVPGNHVTRHNFEQAGVEVEPFIEDGKRLYDADVLANDTEIQALWERLVLGDASGNNSWDDDLILIITSDHGEEFFEHGGTSHGYSLYQEMIRVPLLIHAPGLLPEGLRISQPVASVDIYPTLLDLLELGVPSGLRGRSLLPLIREPHSVEEVPVYSELTEDPGGRALGSGSGIGYSLIQGKWKFLLNLRNPTHRQRPRHELFDRIADPHDRHNVADQHPDLVARFEDQVLRWSAANLGLAPVADTASEQVDEETLEALRALGYLSDDRAPSTSGPSFPPLARAILEGADAWTLYGLHPDPDRPDGQPGKFEASFHGHRVLEKGILAQPGKQNLTDALDRAMLAAVPSHEATAGTLPCLGIEASYRLHTVTLLVRLDQGKVQVHLGDAQLAELSLDPSQFPAIESVFRSVGISSAASE